MNGNWYLRLLMGNEGNKERNSWIWNMVASLFYSLQSAALLVVVNRVGGLVVGGIFAITYSLSQMFSNIGNMSMREYQVSDYNNKYSFANYIATRFLTVPLMAVTCMGYGFFHGYTGEKILTLAFLLLYRCVDSVDDTLHAEIQKRGRLDVASRVWATRIFLASAAFMITYAMTNNLVVASAVMALSAIILSLAMNISVYRYMGIRLLFSFDGVLKLIFEVFPVCVGAFLYSYLVNAPKVAIDSVLEPEMQTVFNVIFLPTFVINMFSIFVIKPYVLKMGELWNQNDLSGFVKLVTRIVAIILVLTVVVMAGGYLLGVPVLGMVFDIKLEEYRELLVLLLLFGGITALVSLGLVVITVMRQQFGILISYAVAMVADLLLMRRLVIRYSLWGAGLVYGLAISIVLICYSIFIVGGMFRKKKSINT